ncbi:MAG: tol-pal system-associated acyl-CoA thioesterase [Pseudomonadota bacterium]
MSPSPHEFTWPIRVYYEDTDMQGVVYYANYFRFMERARTEWIRTLGIEQDAFLREHRRLFVVVETQAEFHQPARFNDQLAVTVELQDRSRASFLLRQRIFRDTPDGALLCNGSVRAACINADTSKPARLPDLLFEEQTP